MKRFFTLSAMFISASVFAEKSTLIDFSQLSEDTSEATTIDYSNEAAKMGSIYDAEEMKIDLSMKNWIVELDPSSRTVFNRRVFWRCYWIP